MTFGRVRQNGTQFLLIDHKPAYECAKALIQYNTRATLASTYSYRSISKCCWRQNFAQLLKKMKVKFDGFERYSCEKMCTKHKQTKAERDKQTLCMHC